MDITNTNILDDTVTFEPFFDLTKECIFDKTVGSPRTSQPPLPKLCSRRPSKRSFESDDNGLEERAKRVRIQELSAKLQAIASTLAELKKFHK
jgi:hypothetical protein